MSKLALPEETLESVIDRSFEKFESHLLHYWRVPKT